MPGRSSPSDRRSPFATASPLEREAIMNSVNANLVRSGQMSDTRSKMSKSTVDDFLRKSSILDDFTSRKMSETGRISPPKRDEILRMPSQSVNRESSRQYLLDELPGKKTQLLESNKPSQNDFRSKLSSLTSNTTPSTPKGSRSVPDTQQAKLDDLDRWGRPKSGQMSQDIHDYRASLLSDKGKPNLRDEEGSKNVRHSPAIGGSSLGRSGSLEDSGGWKSYAGRSSSRDDVSTQRKSSALSELTGSSRGKDDYRDRSSYKSRLLSGKTVSSDSSENETKSKQILKSDKRQSLKEYGQRSVSPPSSRGYSESSVKSSMMSKSEGPLGLRGTKSGEKQREQTKEDVGRVKGKKKKKKGVITANLSGTRYDVVRKMVEQLGYTVTSEDDPNAYLIWNDCFVSTERITELKPYQRINHFPGMGEICRKDCLARNMAKIAKQHPEEFNFVPKTWCLPSESTALQTYIREMKKKKKTKTFIVKPANGAMGNGICLVRNPEKLPWTESMIVQEYVDKPLLVDGYKCDMRVYVLMTSCDPLRVFLFNDGLLRMSTEQYVHPTDHNIDHLFMHLTNYSVNKHNDLYNKSGSVDSGHKRTLQYFREHLRSHDYDVAFLWKKITDVIVKTMLVALPHVLHAYRMCRPGQAPSSDSVSFEVLGFDIMLDKKLRPWLLEVNRSPSFGTDEKLDYDIKSVLIEDSLRLLNIRASDKRKNIAAEKALTQKRLTRPSKRIDLESSELMKRRVKSERKREELKDMLQRIRKDATREDFENRNCGNFKRIFPPDDKFSRERYAEFVTSAFSGFMTGRKHSFQREIERAYTNKYREEDVLDMLAQCEADELSGPSKPQGPKPLYSMPTLSRQHHSDSDETGEDDPPRKPPRTQSSRAPLATRTTPPTHKSAEVKQEESREEEEELVQRTLNSLNVMRIKFPGKSDDEAEIVLDKILDNWKFHKPQVASYWLVKLDSIKRRKVVDIVRSNVRVMVQRTWKSPDIDSLRIYRVFTRVFNRLLWSHGQGLWNCFQSSGKSWEMIFSKSSDCISPAEMACCRRIVQLCKDCLLIVYQFASETKNGPPQERFTADSRPS